MVFSSCHPTYWLARRTYTTKARGMGRQRPELQYQCSNLGPQSGPRRSGASARRVICCVCPIACERAPRLAGLGPSPARSWDAPAVPGIGTPRLSRCALATGTPTRQALSDRPRGARACPIACVIGGVCGPGVRPRRLRSVRTCDTHVQPSQDRRSHPGEAAEPCALFPQALGFSVTPELRPSPPYPQKPTGRSPRPRATLTLFGAPAGRSVFSLPAGPDANVEKDGSSASLTAMSDSPGGCLWAGWGAKEGRSQGPTLDRHSGVSHQPSRVPSPCVAPTSLM